jgi:glycerate kinase
MARYGLLADGKTAVIEMAASSGLALLAPSERNPMLASSFGAGQLVLRALSEGASRIIIGIGDSATVDGGIGALQAVGVRLLDSRGRPVGQGGGALARIHTIDASTTDPRVRDAEIVIASDVTSPLLGPSGAAMLFAPQKGATNVMVRKLESGLERWAELLSKVSGKDISSIPGSGSAGGFATGFVALFNAKITSGSLLVFDYGNLREKLASSSIVFTAEGSIDEQTLEGKVAAKLAEAAREANVPLIAFAARIAISPQQMRSYGFSAIVPIVDKVIDLEKALKDGPLLLQASAARTLQMLLLGASLKKPAAIS